MNDTPIRYHADALTQYAARLLQGAGLAEAMAQTVADTLVQGDLLGHDTHGLALLSGYVKELEAGTMRREGEPLVVSDRPAAVLWDGQRLPGPWLVHQGLDLLLPRARELGTASLVIRRSHHIACLAVYLLRALRGRHAAACWPAPTPTPPASRPSAAPRRCSRPIRWRWAFRSPTAA